MCVEVYTVLTLLQLTTVKGRRKSLRSLLI